ncbi:MAG: S1C family serine protease [Planctomycetes bacterium]|nr:S1C family serine protease [Planctomycetota bacterium]
MNRLAPLLLTVALCVIPARPAGAQDAAQSAADAVDALERRTQEIAADAARSVVAVTAETRPSNNARTLFAGVIVVPPQRPPERLEAAGFFVRESGVLITTIEVARDPAQFTVRLADGSTRAAELVGTDDEFRIAVLRLAGEPVELTGRAATPAGGAVRAIVDSAPFDTARRSIGWLVFPSADAESPEVQLATVRAASCAESRYDRFLASSIVIPQGAAGAPLLANDGHLLGVAVASAGMHMNASGAVEACRKTLFVRGDDVLAAAAEILRDGRVRHARLGVLLDGDTNHVDQVIPGGPAELAGFRDGDKIVSLAGVPVADAPAISRVLIRRRPGDVLPVDVRRGDAVVALRATVDEIAMPRFPVTSPLPGAILEIVMLAETQASPATQVVSIREITLDGSPAAAGGKVGDEDVSIDRIDVRRFLQRHRVRPAMSAPSEMVVRRDGTETKLVLRR